jgi:hypothetical protein
VRFIYGMCVSCLENSWAYMAEWCNFTDTIPRVTGTQIDHRRLRHIAEGQSLQLQRFLAVFFRGSGLTVLIAWYLPPFVLKCASCSGDDANFVRT